MFKYFLISLTLLTFTSCTNTQATPSSTVKSTGNAIESVSQTIEKALFVDVREDDEWVAGHIEGALHVKLGDIEAGKFEQIPKDTPVALYCRSGRRSGIAYDILTKAGYTNITNAGGIEQVQGAKIIRE